MKKVICFLMATAMCLAMTACGEGTASSSKASSSAIASSSSAPVSSAPQAKYYFKDNVLVSEDVKIEIEKYKVIQPGEKGNEYGKKPVIAFWYKTTNLSGKEKITSMSAWIAMFKAIQDNDPNKVNTLEVGMLPDSQFSDSQMQEIKKDGTVEDAVAYELSDTTTPVTLKATKGIGGEKLGEQNYDLK
ncbi:DUF5067 domain-containing protein [Caproicibacterium sp. NSD3]